MHSGRMHRVKAYEKKNIQLSLDFALAASITMQVKAV